jgi:hypothetical protein
MPVVASNQIKTPASIQVVSTKFKCDGRQYCSQMTSREEAEFFTKIVQIQKWMATMMEFLVKKTVAFSTYQGRPNLHMQSDVAELRR